jgi:tetratricopeptide (TPR) repeat protein
VLRKETLFKSISFRLSLLKTYVESANDNRLYDVNVVAEDFFAKLLNCVYGHSLTNLNHSGLNAVAIDLGDTVARLAFQVTSERNATKIQKTLNKFAEHGLSGDFNKLKVLLIADRTGAYGTVKVPGGITFNGVTDVIDINDLIRDIMTMEIERLEAIDKLLNEEIQIPKFTQGPTTKDAGLEQIEARQKELLQQQAAHSRETAELIGMIGELRRLVKAPQDDLPEAVASVHQQSLDLARDLLKEHKPSQALALLEKQRPILWPTATGALKATFLGRIGAAKLALGMEDEAAKLFFEAREHNPDDEKVLANTALGHLLLGERNKASEAARIVLERNPKSNQALSVLIQSSDESLEHIIELVPQTLRSESEIAGAIGFVARQRGDLTAAEQWLRRAVDADPDRWPEAKGMLGEIIVSRLTGTPTSMVRLGELSDEAREDLEYALASLKDACDAIIDEAALRSRVTWLVNASVVARLLDNASDSDTFIQRAQKLAPDNPAVQYQSAVWAHYKGNDSMAIGFAKKLIGSAEVPHAHSFLAQLQWQADEKDTAVKTLEDYLSISRDEEQALLAQHMLVELYMGLSRLADAETLLAEMVAASPNNVNVLVTASQFYRRAQKPDQATATLEKAVRVLTATTPASHAFLLANELGSQEQWTDSARVFDRIVNKKANTETTRKYLHACYRSGQFDEALKICKQLREANGPIEFVTDLEITMLETIGDLKTAKSVCEDYVSAFPEDGKRRVQLAVIDLRDQDFAALDGFLSSPPDWRKLPVEYALQIANLYSARKRFREALELLYEIRRVNFLGKVHLQYIHTFFFQNKDRQDWLDCNEVVAGAAVGIKDARNEVQWFIIEDRADIDEGKLELSVGSELAKQFIGKKVGDKVLLKKSMMGDEFGTVAELKSKYVYALHESTRIFETRFPEQAGAFFSINLPEGDEGVKQLLEKLGKQEDARQKAYREAFEFYKRGPVTVGAFAKMLGVNIVEGWGALTSRRDSKIVCAAATGEERVTAIRLLDGPAKLIIDPISLLTIHALGVADDVVSTVGRLGIVQSTVDLLTEMHLKDMCINREGFMRLTKFGEEFRRQEVTAEQMAASLMSIEKLVEWIRKNCDVVPWSPSLAAKQEERKELEEIIGEESFDTVLAAATPEHAIFSDDLRLRMYAKAEFDVDGLGSQAILIRSLERKIISRERYDNAVIQLASAGYLHTSIDSTVLLTAAKQAEWLPSSPVIDITWLLNGEHCNENLAVGVVADFIRLMWEQPILPRSTDYLLFHLLDTLSVGRDAMRVSNKLLGALSHTLALAPIAEVEMGRTIRAWRSIRIV